MIYELKFGAISCYSFMPGHCCPQLPSSFSPHLRWMEKFSSPDLGPLGWLRVTDKRDLRKNPVILCTMKEVQRKSSNLARVTKKLLSQLEPNTGLLCPQTQCSDKTPQDPSEQKLLHLFDADVQCRAPLRLWPTNGNRLFDLLYVSFD